MICTNLVTCWNVEATFKRKTHRHYTNKNVHDLEMKTAVNSSGKWQENGNLLNAALINEEEKNNRRELKPVEQTQGK